MVNDYGMVPVASVRIWDLFWTGLVGTEQLSVTSLKKEQI